MRLKLTSLILQGNNKDYSVNFREGFNLISGPTSTGKTSILEMIDYALGAKKHKSYIEIGNTCTYVILELFIGEKKYRIKRRLFEFNEPAVVEEWDTEKEEFLFYNRMEIDSPKNPRSLSAFLLEKMGFTDVTIMRQAFSFRDIFKYCYLKQTEIDNEDIMGEKSWEKNNKRKATFEIIFNIYDKELEELKERFAEKKDEKAELEIKLAGIQDFLQNIDIQSATECLKTAANIQNEIFELRKQLEEAKSQKEYEVEESVGLRKDIQSIKNNLQKVVEEKSAQEQYLNKLRLLYNQYGREIEKKALAIDGYVAFDRFEFKFCPNCLQPVSDNRGGNTCCLCGQEASSETSEILILKKEISMLKRKAKELSRFIEGEDQKYDEIERLEVQIRSQLREAEVELDHLSSDYVNPYLERIEYCNYEIGTRNRRLAEIQRESVMFEVLKKYQNFIDEKQTVIDNIQANIKAIRESPVDKNDVLKQLTTIFQATLAAFQYPKLSSAYIDEKTYLPHVRGRKYNDIGSLAGVTLITMAYYLSVLLVGSQGEFKHPGLLIIDSPRKNLGAQAAADETEEFKDERIFNETLKQLWRVAEEGEKNIQLIVVNNGYPEFIPKECVVAEFDPDGRKGLPRGLIDDAI